MHNFVSLVVNNEGKYVARLTRQVSFEGVEERSIRGKSISPLFNTDSVEEYEYNHHESTPIKNAFLEYIDLDIIKERPHLPDIKAEIERFGEINSKCSSQKTAKIGTSPYYAAKSYPTNYPSAKPQEFDWQMKQGKLFDDEPFADDELIVTKDVVKELKEIPWKALKYDNWIAQLLYGSPFAEYTDLNNYAVTHLNKLYKDRFKNEVDFASWFEMWVDFMLSDFDFLNLDKQCKQLDSEEALIYQTYILISKKDLAYKQVMLQSLLNRLI